VFVLCVHHQATTCLKLAVKMELLSGQVDHTQQCSPHSSTAGGDLQQFDDGGAAGFREKALSLDDRQVAKQNQHDKNQGQQQQQQVVAAVGDVVDKYGCVVACHGTSTVLPSDVKQQKAGSIQQSGTARLAERPAEMACAVKRRRVKNQDALFGILASAAAAAAAAAPPPSPPMPMRSADAVRGTYDAVGDLVADSPQTPCSAHFVFTPSSKAKEEDTVLPAPPGALSEGMALQSAARSSPRPLMAAGGVRALTGQISAASEVSGAGHAAAAGLVRRVARVLSRAQAALQALTSMVVPCAAELLTVRQEIATVSLHALPEAHTNMAAAMTALNGLEASVLLLHQQLTQTRAHLEDRTSRVTHLQSQVAAAEQRDRDQRQRVVAAVAELVDIAAAAAHWPAAHRGGILAVGASLLQAFAEPVEVQLPVQQL
jgi:hypothetical protein